MSLKILKLLKRPFCKHKHFVLYDTWTERDKKKGWAVRKYSWICKDCGKVVRV